MITVTTTSILQKKTSGDFIIKMIKKKTKWRPNQKRRKKPDKHNQNTNWVERTVNYDRCMILPSAT